MKTVRQLLQSKGSQVHTIAADAKVIEALRVMAEKEIGALVVVDGSRVAGVISERDYARKVILQGKSSHDIPVREIMTAKVHMVDLKHTVDECMAIMTEKRVRHLPVLENDQLSGILSIGDLVKEVIAEQQQTIRELETYIHT